MTTMACYEVEEAESQQKQRRATTSEEEKARARAEEVMTLFPPPPKLKKTPFQNLNTVESSMVVQKQEIVQAQPKSAPAIHCDRKVAPHKSLNRVVSVKSGLDLIDYQANIVSVCNHIEKLTAERAKLETEFAQLEIEVRAHGACLIQLHRQNALTQTELDEIKAISSLRDTKNQRKAELIKKMREVINERAEVKMKLSDLLGAEFNLLVKAAIESISRPMQPKIFHAVKQQLDAILQSEQADMSRRCYTEINQTPTIPTTAEVPAVVSHVDSDSDSTISPITVPVPRKVAVPRRTKMKPKRKPGNKPAARLWWRSCCCCPCC